MRLFLANGGPHGIIVADNRQLERQGPIRPAQPQFRAVTPAGSESRAATQLVAITALLPANGLVVRWACWKMYSGAPASSAGAPVDATSTPTGKTLGQAVFQIMLAGVSMSLDNGLAVAGTARHTSRRWSSAWCSQLS